MSSEKIDLLDSESFIVSDDCQVTESIITIREVLNESLLCVVEEDETRIIGQCPVSESKDLDN